MKHNWIDMPDNCGGPYIECTQCGIAADSEHTESKECRGYRLDVTQDFREAAEMEQEAALPIGGAYPATVKPWAAQGLSSADRVMSLRAYGFAPTRVQEAIDAAVRDAAPKWDLINPEILRQFRAYPGTPAPESWRSLWKACISQRGRDVPLNDEQIESMAALNWWCEYRAPKETTDDAP